jgi:hypothetical protein
MQNLSSYFIFATGLGLRQVNFWGGKEVVDPLEMLLQS